LWEPTSNTFPSGICYNHRRNLLKIMLIKTIPKRASNLNSSGIAFALMTNLDRVMVRVTCSSFLIRRSQFKPFSNSIYFNCWRNHWRNSRRIAFSPSFASFFG
jgi:hypothetical protein